MYNDRRHFQRMYASIPNRFGFRASTREQWLAWRRAFRPRLREALGLGHMEADLESHRPRAERLAVERFPDYVRESWRLWVEPSVPLPFYLLVPKAAHGRLPLILTPHGHNHPEDYVGVSHNEEEERSIREGERDIACQGVREGYIVIAPTARGFGETRTAGDRERNALCSCRIELMHGLLAGRTVIGERVWDMSRLIDWALSRDDIDARRIAITGNSGGGTVSLFAAACDTRIAVAVPSCYYCTFQGSIGSIQHCDCNYVPGILRLGEMYDVAGLIAPRPFRAIAGESDDIFPIEHVRFAFRRLKRIYAVAGVPRNCELYVGEGGHRYYKAGAWPFIRARFLVRGSASGAGFARNRAVP